jgi:hypothetical protein
MSVLQIFLNVFFGAGAIGFVLIASWLYWRVARTKAREVLEVVPKVWSTFLKELDELLQQDSAKVSRAARVSRKDVEQVRMRWICKWLVKMQHNIELFHAAGRCEVARASSGMLTNYDAELAHKLLQQAILRHCAVICLQKYFRILLALNSIGWPLTRPVVAWTLRRLSDEIGAYCILEQTMLKVTKTYGRVHYENLLAAL